MLFLVTVLNLFLAENPKALTPAEAVTPAETDVSELEVWDSSHVDDCCVWLVLESVTDTVESELSEFCSFS